MAEFTVTSNEVRNKAQELSRLNTQLEQKIQQLETEEGSLASMWEGDAHDAFSTAFKNNKAKMTLFHAEINKYISALGTIAAKYELAERNNVTTASSKPELFMAMRSS